MNLLTYTHTNSTTIFKFANFLSLFYLFTFYLSSDYNDRFPEFYTSMKSVFNTRRPKGTHYVSGAPLFY